MKIIILFLLQLVASEEILEKDFKIVKGNILENDLIKKEKRMESLMKCVQDSQCLFVSCSDVTGECLHNTQWNSQLDSLNGNGIVFMSNQVHQILPNPGFVHGENSSIFFLQNIKMRYNEALVTCKNVLGPSAHLLWIQNENKATVIHQQLSGMLISGESYFIGLTDRYVENTFVWDGGIGPGMVADYTRWYSGEPNDAAGNSVEDCVALFYGTTFEWQDCSCNFNIGSICELDF